MFVVCGLPVTSKKQLVEVRIDLMINLKESNYKKNKNDGYPNCALKWLLFFTPNPL